jgi:hypothetical protein
MGDQWNWADFTANGENTMMRFSGLISGEFWELKRIDTKSNVRFMSISNNVS